MNNTDIGDYLKEKGEVLIAPLGGSMRPLLRGDRCQVLLQYPEKPLKKYDVVLYRAGAGDRKNLEIEAQAIPGGKLILHRIIKVLPTEYIICGDNTYRMERGITDREILGVMKGFYRKNRYISCENLLYQCYVRLWWLLYPLRCAAFGVLRCLIRRKRKND